MLGMFLEKKNTRWLLWQPIATWPLKKNQTLRPSPLYDGDGTPSIEIRKMRVPDRPDRAY